jgi:uncharacterized protein (TIGR02145 family)
MKIIKLVSLLAVALLLSNCRKNKDPNNIPTGSLLEVTRVLTATEDKFIEYGQPAGTTPQAALGLTAEWLKKQPNVSSADVEDNTGITIKLKSGMSGIFFLSFIGQDSLSISRGSGSGGTLLKVVSTKPSKNIIENKKVLLCYPNLNEFYKDEEVQNIIDRFKNSNLGLEVTKKEWDEVTPDLVSTFGDYGLVFLNTHGYSGHFLSGAKIEFSEGDTTEQMVREWVIYHFSQKTLDNLDLGLLQIGMYGKIPSGPDWVKHYVKKLDSFIIWICGKYLNSLPPMSNTIIFGNFCFSGRTVENENDPNPIGTAFKDLDLISYYCYDDGTGRSDIVSNPFAKAMEDSLARSFVIDNDSTGNAHLSYTGAEFKDPFNSGFLKQFGAKDYCFSDCIKVFTDDRDGIIYKAVCIGEQNWMAENLRYNAPGSVFYDDDPSNGLIYGKLYDWSTYMNGADSSVSNPSGVQGICPKGWHIPSPAEWEMLITAVGHDIWSLKDKNYWNPPNTLATDKYGFSARGGGNYNIDDYYLLNVFGEYGTTRKETGGNTAYRFQTGTNTLIPAGISTAKKISCRCVKD